MFDLLATVWRLLLIAVMYAFIWRLSLGVVRGVLGEAERGGDPAASPEGGHAEEGSGGARSELVVVSTPGDPPAGAHFSLGDRATIGRGPENDVVVKDAFASWHHAQVYRRGRWVFVEDLNSKNGTLVNGRRIKKRVALKAGDQLSIGDTVFEFKE